MNVGTNRIISQSTLLPDYYILQMKRLNRDHMLVSVANYGICEVKVSKNLKFSIIRRCFNSLRCFSFDQIMTESVFAIDGD